MADLIAQSAPAHTDAEYQAALAVYLAETQILLNQMQTEQADIDRWKDQAHLRDGEMASLKRQTQEMLTRLEAML